MIKEKSSSNGVQTPVTNINKLIVVSSLLTGGFLLIIIISPAIDRYMWDNSRDKFEDASTMFHPNTSSTKPDKVEDTSAKIHPSTSSTKPENNANDDKQKTRPNPLLPVCDFTSFSTENCDMDGDIRIHGNTSQVFIVSDKEDISREENRTWIVRPYARKFDKNLMQQIRNVSVRIVSKREAPPCQVNHSVSAIIFNVRGFSGNYWHAFNDILVPLFITARQFNGEVQLLVTQMSRWWVAKYSNYFQKMSKYDVIDLDSEDAVHCFPRVIVGLQIHKEFNIDPARAPNGYTMQDFSKFMHKAYSLKRSTAINLREKPGKKPRIFIMPRKNTRMLMNMNEIVPMVEALGFEAVIQGSTKNSLMDAAEEVNSCDMMMGVHGAGLTNMVFLPTNAVVIQIIPFGKFDMMCHNDFGIPAMDMKLKYIAYNITEEESTLVDLYRRDDPVFTDPMSFHKRGWGVAADIYLVQQNVRLNVTRFRPILQQAIKLLSGEPDS